MEKNNKYDKKVGIKVDENEWPKSLVSYSLRYVYE